MHFVKGVTEEATTCALHADCGECSGEDRVERPAREERRQLAGVSLSDMKIAQAESGCESACPDKTETAGIQGDHVGVGIKHREKAGREAITGPDVERGGGAQVEMTDCAEIRLERMSPPTWGGEEQTIAEVRADYRTCEPTEILVDEISYVRADTRRWK
jgi:hypothetical protein